MVSITKEKIEIDESLVSRLVLYVIFGILLLSVENGCIRKKEHTNLTHIESHRIIIKNKLYLVFNYSSEIYVHTLGKKKQYIK